ncbi:MAG TPA: hypothetical protein VK432_06305 [Stellaceae bacterium]|nr:hypothetical protein [Stellaceae bacterium]
MTALLVVLGLVAVYSDVLNIGYQTGLLFLFFAVLMWFQWEVISEGFRTAKDESNIPIIRMGAKGISGLVSLFHGPPRRRSSSPSGS